MESRLIDPTGISGSTRQTVTLDNVERNLLHRAALLCDRIRDRLGDEDEIGQRAAATAANLDELLSTHPWTAAE